MSELEPQAYRKTAYTHRLGLAIERPEADTVLPGTLYFSTDTEVIERSNGVEWEPYSAVEPPPESDFFFSDIDILGEPDKFYDAIAQETPALEEFTTKLEGDILNLDFGNAKLIRMNNAALATIKGLKAGVAGQEVTIVSVGAGQVDLSHQSTSTDENTRLINIATSAPSSLAAGSGTAIYRYDGTTLRWRLIKHEQGAWITVPYLAGNYTASAGTWTVDAGDVTTHAYKLEGRTLNVALTVQTSTISAGAGAFLQIPCPGGFTVKATTFNLLDYFGTDPRAIGSTQMNSDEIIYMSKADGTGWLAGVNNTAVRANANAEVN